MIYANNAGTSWPKAPGVAEAVSATLAATPAEYDHIFSDAHARVANFLGVSDPDQLLITSGCTSALGVAVGDLPWMEGDVVITSSMEHHALARTVDKLDRERGVRHERLAYRPGVPLDLDELREVLIRGRVKLVAVTAASNVTGERLPLDDVIALSHEHGALVLVDGAQTAGVVPTNLEQLGADIFTFAGHKGPLGPQGVGGLWAHPNVVFETPWATCDLGDDPTAIRPRCGASLSWCDVGSVNLAGLAGLAAGMDWLQQGSPLGANALALAARLIERVVVDPRATLVGEANVARTATVAMAVPDLPLEVTESHFRERGIVVRAGSHCAPWALEALGLGHGVLRVSFGPFNQESDVDAVMAALL